MYNIKLGSLFDGSGGFPLAGSICGIKPRWASEIEPYPIAVTKSRFPGVKHIGNVKDIKGAEVEPVDVITFGSPCQDMSVAGKRAGLKHEDNGDDETTRSGLFMEAVRIIREMREKTNGEYPRFAVWENVPGAFSSNKGEDFRTVCEELIKIAEPSAVMPPVPKAGWAYADCYSGDGWSLAYRVLDAQYWGVPQHRRRIYLVLDLGGQRAREVLFKSDRLSRNTEQSTTSRETTPAYVERSVRADDREVKCYGISSFMSEAMKSDNPHSGIYEADTSRTLDVHGANHACNQGGIAVVEAAAGFIDGNSANARGIGYEDEKAPTIRAGATPFCKSARAQTADGATTWKRGETANTLNTFDTGESRANELVVALDRASFNQGKNARYEPQYYTDGTNQTIVAKGPSAVCYGIGNGQADQTDLHDIPGALNCMHEQQAVLVGEHKRYIVRRLTPTECARLQGFPDEWGHPDHKDALTDEEYAFWTEVRCTHAVIDGKEPKTYRRDQMLKWYNKLHTDSAEYKMWGNGIALPCAVFVMSGIAEVLRRDKNAE